MTAEAAWLLPSHPRTSGSALAVALAVVGVVAVLTFLYAPSGIRYILIAATTAVAVGVCTRSMAMTVGWTLGTSIGVLFAATIQASYFFLVAAPLAGGLVAGLIVPTPKPVVDDPHHANRGVCRMRHRSRRI